MLAVFVLVALVVFGGSVVGCSVGSVLCGSVGSSYSVGGRFGESIAKFCDGIVVEMLLMVFVIIVLLVVELIIVSVVVLVCTDGHDVAQRYHERRKCSRNFSLLEIEL